MQPHTTPRMLKAQDVAQCLGLTQSTVYDWIARGYLPCHRFGRTIRVSADDLKAYLAGSRINDLATERELGAQEALGVKPTGAPLDNSVTCLAQGGDYDPRTPQQIAAAPRRVVQESLH